MARHHNDKYTREIDRFWREADAIYHEVAVRVGMSDSSFDILYAIARLGEGCTQKDISNEVLLSKQTLNSSIHKLADRGVLELHAHGRNASIHLTDEGRKLLKAKIDPVFEAEGRALDAVGIDNMREFLRISKLYQDALRKTLLAVE
jgi:DNA-binding MarR family transcriptional regulator